MKIAGSTLFQPKKGFGKGKRALSAQELAEAVRLKREGVPTAEVARVTGLNRRTVDRLWGKQQPLPELLDNLGKEAVQHDPALAERAGDMRVLTAAPGRNRRSSAKTATIADARALGSDLDPLERTVANQILRTTLRYWEMNDPQELVKYGRRVLDRLLLGDMDLLDKVAWEAVQEDRFFRQEVAELALEKMRGQATHGQSKAPRRGATSSRSTARQLVKALQTQELQQSSTQAALFDCIKTVFGPGGAGTHILSATMPSPADQPKGPAASHQTAAPGPTTPAGSPTSASGITTPLFVGLFSPTQLWELLAECRHRPAGTKAWQHYLGSTTSKSPMERVQMRTLLEKLARLRAAELAPLWGEFLGHPEWEPLVRYVERYPSAFTQLQRTLKAALKHEPAPDPAGNGFATTKQKFTPDLLWSQPRQPTSPLRLDSLLSRTMRRSQQEGTGDELAQEM